MSFAICVWIYVELKYMAVIPSGGRVVGHQSAQGLLVHSSCSLWPCFTFPSFLACPIHHGLPPGFGFRVGTSPSARVYPICCFKYLHLFLGRISHECVAFIFSSPPKPILFHFFLWKVHCWRSEKHRKAHRLRCKLPILALPWHSHCFFSTYVCCFLFFFFKEEGSHAIHHSVVC